MPDSSSDPGGPKGSGPLGGGGFAKAAGLSAVACGAFALSLAVAPGLCGVALAGLCLAIAVVDTRSMVIPDELNGLALVLGLAAAGLNATSEPVGAIADAAARAATMFALFYLFRALYRRVRGVAGMGLGDVKLAAAAGAWLDWPYLPVVVDIAALSALAVALLAILRGREVTLSARIPFGAFFAPSIWACWLFASWRSAPL